MLTKTGAASIATYEAVEAMIMDEVSTKAIPKEEPKLREAFGGLMAAHGPPHRGVF